MVQWLLSTTRCKTFALIGRCLRSDVIILQRVVDLAVRLQRPAIGRRCKRQCKDDNVRFYRFLLCATYSGVPVSPSITRWC